MHWLADVPPREVSPRLTGRTSADLVVVGGGYGGLWAALLAKERDPGRDVALAEGRTVGWAASGRNGGFVSSSLTHGQANGLAHFAEDYPALVRIGRDNLDAIEHTLSRLGIDAEWERTGELTVAVAPWQLDDLHAHVEVGRTFTPRVRMLDGDETRALVDSPSYLGARYDPDGVALVHPAKLVWGLAEACRRAGVRVFEHTPVRRLRRAANGIDVLTRDGVIRAGQVALATNAFPSPLRRARPYTVPVYDHVIVTEPLAPDVRAALRWAGREGISDGGNLFHYYRLTRDDRIVFGGYVPGYHFGKGIRVRYDVDRHTAALLVEHLLATFPALAGTRVDSTWGGVIDTSTRFSPLFGTAYGGRVAYVTGFTGLGVAATRFGAQVVLDLLDGSDTELTALSMVRKRPLPFPPEPFAWAGITTTTRALARADAAGGRRGPWLRLLDRLGVGFDF
ncbi:MAG: hypothetical protein QOG52_1285 [Frankiaceae bacterium]|nr:hypothetical protein [Frankiaceae bacterium]